MPRIQTLLKPTVMPLTYDSMHQEFAGRSASGEKRRQRMSLGQRGEAAIQTLILLSEIHDQVRLQNEVLAIPCDRVLLAPGKLCASGGIYHVARRVSAIKIGM